MLPGPVFTFEMMMIARRGRFYVTRAFYATVLLLILWSVHSSWSSWVSAYQEGELPLADGEVVRALGPGRDRRRARSCWC